MVTIGIMTLTSRTFIGLQLVESHSIENRIMIFPDANLPATTNRGFFLDLYAGVGNKDLCHNRDVLEFTAVISNQSDANLINEA